MINSLRPAQDKTADIFQCIFLNENVLTSRKISLTPEVRINNIPALV